MPRDISHQRCFNHANREAAALCLECRRYFCRECVTEHEDRVICADCLASLTAVAARHVSRVLGVLARSAQVAIGLLILFVFFYLLGQGLIALPTSFHEGTVWKSNMWEP